MRTIFQNCTLLDGTEQMSPRPGTDVAIENDKIVQIGKITPNKGDRVVDLTGKYLMPIYMCTCLRGASPKTSP